MIVPLWRGFTGWYDNDLVVAQAARTADLVEEAQRAQARNALAFHQALLRLQDVRDVPDLLEEIDYGREVAPLEAYARPAVQYRYRRSTGETDEDSLEFALERLEKLAEDDLADANRRAAREVARAVPRIQGQRRIIHPELSAGGTCGLCIAAATQWYGRDELMPLHDRCKCESVMVLRGQPDPGLTLNDEDLQELYRDAGGSLQEDLKRTRYTVNRDGELESLLVPDRAKARAERNRGSAWGPDRTEKDRGRGPARRSSTGADEPLKDHGQEITALEDSLERLRERAAAGEDVTAPIKYHEDRLRKLRRQASSQNAGTPPAAAAGSGGGSGNPGDGGGGRARSPEPGDDDWLPRGRVRVSPRRFRDQPGFENVDFANVTEVYEHEAYTAKRLARNGHTVQFRPEAVGEKQADIVLDSGHAWDMKAPQGASARNVESAIKDGKEQSDRIIVDLFRFKGSLDDALAGAHTALRVSRRIMEVLVLDKAGREHTVRRE